MVLAPTVTSCAMPKGIFAGKDGQPSGGMMSMIAYGPETNIVYPPKPADPKTPWNPEWNVRVRNKSTTMAMLGMSIDASQSAQQQEGQPQQPQESKGKKFLKGLLGR